MTVLKGSEEEVSVLCSVGRCQMRLYDIGRRWEKIHVAVDARYEDQFGSKTPRHSDVNDNMQSRWHQLQTKARAKQRRSKIEHGPSFAPLKVSVRRDLNIGPDRFQF